MESVHMISNLSSNRNNKLINITNKNIKFENSFIKAKTDSVLKELEKRFGMKIDVRSIKKGHKNVSRYATSAGASPIVIAPNILEKMSTDINLKKNITSCIQRHINSIPSGKKFLAAHGRQLVATGTIVHEDGTVTHWTMSVETPEEKERIEEQMEAEYEEKLEKAEANNLFINTSLDNINTYTYSLDKFIYN